MNPQKIHFELVSPEQRLVSEDVALAAIPGVEGELGVGADHASFVVALQSGTVRLYSESPEQVTRRIFIAGGFADITNRQVMVLAEEAVDVQNLNRAAVEQKIQDLSEDLLRASDALEKKRIESALSVQRAKLAAILQAA